MAYSILNTDGTTLVLLADGDVDESTTSISLIGKNVNGYGQYINNNFIKLLGNFANTSGSPPTNPIKGQLWYDTTVKGLKIYDKVWKTISGATLSDVQLTTLGSGDFWWDTKNNQLKIIINKKAYVVGPAITSTVGETGFAVPTTPIKDINDNALKITLVKSYGVGVAFISNTKVQLNTTDSALYLNTATMYSVAGLNVLGDFQALGQTRTKYYSMAVDIDPLMNNANTLTDITSPGQVLEQNLSICRLLEKMYPCKPVKFYREPGTPILSEARVLCKYTNPTPGYHVRRFYVQEGSPTADYNFWTDYQTTGSGAIQNLVF